MQRSLCLWCLLLGAAGPAFGRQNSGLCGTDSERSKEEHFLHQQAVKARRLASFKAGRNTASQERTAARDIGNIALIEDSDGVVALRNEFNLDHRTLTFSPSVDSAARYRFAVTGESYDADAAASGAQLGLDDDDTRVIPIPFAFPFFGTVYRQIYANSDGNITFESGDASHDSRSIGRMTAGPPRISALFSDLDPSKNPASVRVTSEADRLVLSWVQVPEYSDTGFARSETFQIRLYPAGRIELAYSGVNTGGAVVGISPGRLNGSSNVLSFTEGSDAEFSSTVAERFGGTTDIDIETVAQKFYAAHEDAYDYLVIYNNLGIKPLAGAAVAFEQTMREVGTGYGHERFEQAAEAGSSGRLQALLNLGPLNQYPQDPNALVPARALVGDSSLSVLAHEAGHLFLAYVSVADPAHPGSMPMLGYQNAHWNFVFNSEASLLEGNRIADRGTGASPRFTTTATVEGYAPLDQYLMGFRAPEEVPPTFFVANTTAGLTDRKPQIGVNFDGDRRDVSIDDIVGAAGRRTPDSTVAQRHFRFGFIVVVAKGGNLSSTELDQVDNYRSQFQAYFSRAASGRAFADTALRRGLRLSVSPAAGVLMGGSAAATISLTAPAATQFSIFLQAKNGLVNIPNVVTIPAGASSAEFTLDGLKPGVEELSATPDDGAFETSYARIQVSPASSLQLATISGDGQTAGYGTVLAAPIIVAATDRNRLLYPGARLLAVDLSGGAVEPSIGITGANGQAGFQWTPGLDGAPQLLIYPEGTDPGTALHIAAVRK